MSFTYAARCRATAIRRTDKADRTLRGDFPYSLRSCPADSRTCCDLFLVLNLRNSRVGTCFGNRLRYNRFDMRPLGEEIRPADTVSAVARSRASKMPEHVETAGARLQSGRLDKQPLAGKIEQAGERLARLLAVGFDIAGLDQRGDDSPALFGEIGRALHDALAQPFAFVAAKQALELQTESPGDIRHGRAELGGPLLPLEGQLRIELAEMLGDEIPEPAERRAERIF